MSSITDVSIGMVPYYNSLTMYCQPQHQQPAAGGTETQQQLSQQAHQQTQAQQAAIQQQAAAAVNADLTSAQQYWYGYPHRHPSHASLRHHQTSSAPQQYLEHPTDVLPWPHHSHYSHHLQYQHQYAAYQQHQHHQQQQMQLSGTVVEWSSDESNPHHHRPQRAIQIGETSPPRTVSGSEISSPGTPSTPPANNNNNLNITNNNNNNSSNNNNNNESLTSIKVEQIDSPFEWMNKSSHQSQSTPGKTRTKDKYRVVYTDHQRLELEKEFHFSRYITIRRKSELATNLALSERQVKIWFQNRRAKERKQSKKRDDTEYKDIKPMIDVEGPGGMVNLGALGGMSSMLSGLMHNGGSSPLSFGPPPHNLTGYSASSLHAHSHQNAHSHPVMGL